MTTCDYSGLFQIIAVIGFFALVSPEKLPGTLAVCSGICSASLCVMAWASQVKLIIICEHTKFCGVVPAAQPCYGSEIGQRP